MCLYLLSNHHSLLYLFLAFQDTDLKHLHTIENSFIFTELPVFVSSLCILDILFVLFIHCSNCQHLVIKNDIDIPISIFHLCFFQNFRITKKKNLTKFNAKISFLFLQCSCLDNVSKTIIFPFSFKCTVELQNWVDTTTILMCLLVWTSTNFVTSSLIYYTKKVFFC